MGCVIIVKHEKCGIFFQNTKILIVNDFSVETRNINPADDINAKWQLSTLLISTLKSPMYTGFFK